MRSGWLAVLLWLSLGVFLGALLVGKGRENSTSTSSWFADSTEVAQRPDGSDLERSEVASENAIGFVDATRMPSLFARRLVLAQLTADADAEKLEQYFAEAGRIGSVSRRIEALEIVLLRSIELDPQLALSMLSSLEPPYDRQLSFRVWRAWGESDFEAALTVAAAQSLSERYAAAEGLYAAAGDLDSPEAREVEAKLRVAPSREMRRRYVTGLVDQSLEEALAYVSLMTSPLERREAIAWIAEYLSPGQLAAALTLPDGLLSAGDQQQFNTAVRLRSVEQDPAGLLEQLLVMGGERPAPAEVRRALQLLVVEDIDLARSFLERSRQGGNYIMLQAIFIEEFSHADPLAAIAWAKDNEDPGARGMGLLGRVLNMVAKSQPSLAFEEALMAPARPGGFDGLHSVLRTVAREDVALAKNMIEQISDPRRRAQMEQVLVQQWAQSNPEAALDWILAQNDESSAALLGNARDMMIRHDIQSAIANLHRLDPKSQQQWRRQIARALVERGSLQEALAFAQRFEAEPDYEALQVTIASRAAKSDPDLARSIAAQLESPAARDRILAETVVYESGMTGIEVEQQLAGISDPGLRYTKASEVYRSWAADDPTGLSSWVKQQASGPARDAALVAMLSTAETYDPQHDALIDSITDPKRRNEAKRARIIRLMRSDPDLAWDLAQDPDISDREREMLRRFVDRSGGLTIVSP